MFTGIIEEIGIVRKILRNEKSAAISLQAMRILDDIKLGDSINTNGACLTVSSLLKNGFAVDVMAETMRKTNLDRLQPGHKVNLERALCVNGRLGGHLVSGHIDGTGTIVQIKHEDIATWFLIKADKHLLKYMINKGSVAIDGISLTIAELLETEFWVSTIPHTKSNTNLTEKKLGDLVNIECDMIGKYIEKFILSNNSNKEEKNQIDLKFLSKHGFLSNE
ncbi:MAG: riboflavin synthase [Bacteroidales bacterium]|nr:riboflavin synthase [Bacteroidales bacterium]MCF8404206.1 riboflavin synthase [Bacteroidales bacterium]